MESKQGVEFRHPGIDTGKRAVIVSAVPIFTADAYFLCQITVVGSDDSAFTCDQKLGRAEAEDIGVALSANWNALIERAKAVGCIEDQLETVPLCDFLQRVDLGGIAEVMYGDNGSCIGGNRRL